MSFKRLNIFITGINGFLGTATAEYFLNCGAHVIGLVRDQNRKTMRGIQDRCSIVYGDVTDKSLVQRIISHYEVDYVIHLASQPIVKICDNDPYTAYNTNVMGVVSVLEACRVMRQAAPRVLVMSSDKFYSNAQELPYVEDLSPIVSDTYCTSKLCQDFIARSYAITYNLPIFTARAGNIYGPGDLNLSRLIPKNTIRILEGDNPVLYGQAAEFVREFLYIDDIMTAFDTLLTKAVPGEAYNIGGTKPYKILDVLELLRDKINPNIKIDVVDVDFYEISKQYLDASKLMSLGWCPKVSLDEGLSRTISWYKDYLNRV